MTTTTSAITANIDSFVSAQNQNRGGKLADGSTLPLDSDALTGAVPAGGNSVTGFSTITATSATISLPTAPGNAVVVSGVDAIGSDGGNGSWDAFQFTVDTSGKITLTDQNTGYSESITGASYLVFNGGAINADGSYKSIYMIETGTNAQVAALYNAALGRVPDLAGLEYYAVPIADGAMTLHQAAEYFIASPEFQAKFAAAALPADDGGPNDQAFVTALYQNILHRTPSASEMAFYVADLQGTLAGVAQQDRAQLLINFAVSPENTSDISGWLINPANGLYTQAGTTFAITSASLGDAVGAGTVNLASFASPTSATEVSYASSTGTTTITGAGNTASGLPAAANQISTTATGLIIDLTATVNVAGAFGSSDTVYGAQSGGSMVTVADAGPTPNGGGTVYLYGTGNTIRDGGSATGVTTPTIIHGFTAGDHLVGSNATGSGALYTGSASSPISGASVAFLGQSAVGAIEVNVGAVADDNATTMAAAANRVYKVGDVPLEDVVFFGQDPSGNTIVYRWGHGDVSGAHVVAASDFTGAVELIGVSAASLTNAQFH